MTKLKTILSKIFSSIGVKLFLSFWLIALCAVIATQIISSQFEQEGVLRPANPSDVRKLRKLSKHLQERPAGSVEKLMKRANPLRNTQFILKESKSSKLFARGNGITREIQPFLVKNKLSNLTSIQFQFSRVTGPVAIKIANNDYQIFISTRVKPRHFRALVMEMPLWMRVSIPIVISIVLSWLLARSLVKPILAMKHTSATFGNGDLSARAKAAALRNDEIGELAKSFNAMAEKIEDNFGAHQRLLADVSHELRSPMTRLQIALGLAAKCKTEPDILQRHLSRCELEVTRLDQMINDVLCLSSLENNTQNTALQEIDLNQLIQTIVEDEQYIANEKGIQIKTEYLHHCIIPADQALMRSAISNILSNAIKYSPEKSVISLYMLQDATHVRLSIVDQGMGVPDADLADMFKPFYRVSQSRERATGGTGLGLAIAQQAITAHQGVISAQNNQGNGLTVSIELPLQSTKLM